MAHVRVIIRNVRHSVVKNVFIVQYILSTAAAGITARIGIAHIICVSGRHFGTKKGGGYRINAWSV